MSTLMFLLAALAGGASAFLYYSDCKACPGRIWPEGDVFVWMFLALVLTGAGVLSIYLES